MITGPRYKKARRLGPSVFDKTQTQKFAMRNAQKEPRGRTRSDFGLQLIEKQKARVIYGVGERQFKRNIKEILSQKGINIFDVLVQKLEGRLDNVIYRLGFAKTRQAARQIVGHGHIDINGHRQTIPSMQVSIGDIITIRERSKKKAIFNGLDERLKEQKVPSWLSLNIEKREAKVQGAPKVAPNELSFDIRAIFQFYSR